MNLWPENPRDPVPYIRAAGGAYAWCCTKYGLDCLGDTPAQALTAWRESYAFERSNGGYWLVR